jgi:hypothetical protein
MPELKNIIPSEEELNAYYREHRADPGIDVLDREEMSPALAYEDLRERFVVCLDAAARAQESGDLRAIEAGFDQLDSELPRDAGPEFDKLHVALHFWDCWIDASNHDWQYYPGLAAGDWPRLARAIVQDLQQNSEISDERVLERFDSHPQPTRTSLWSRLKGLWR